MSNTNEQVLAIVVSGDLTKVTMGELVSTYNELAEKPVAKFPTKDKGAQRIAKLYDLIVDETSVEPKNDKPVVEVKEPVEPTKTVPKKEKEPKEPKVKAYKKADSWRNLKELQNNLNVALDRFGNVKACMSVHKVDGEGDKYLRDQVTIKIAGRREALGRVRIILGEEFKREWVSPVDGDPVAANPDEVKFIAMILVAVTDELAKINAESEAKAKEKEAKKTKNIEVVEETKPEA